ncbi:unnamed protein product [Leptidea sinapis]|uniref:Ionotropic glutamate receptor C-terminal domain-containing protein n=1 Tax=Leptidea sinapis TaxID=189913 RepID=A0A5E4Q0F3_9NEOP|nr:unnamed protein product [Leptidea sinapis]
MTGLQLILSTVCNATFCESIYDNPLIDTRLSRKQNESTFLTDFVNGRHLKIATFNNYPLSWTERTDNGTIIGHGVAFEVVNVLQEKFNFTYEVKVDMAAAFIPILTTYEAMAKFSTVLNEGVWMMMLKRPKESAAGSGLLAPFDEYEKYIPLSPSVWFVYGAFIKQGTTLSPEANTTRILFATWWLFVILLSAFYTANLTAFLTLSKFTLEIERPEDLFKKNVRWLSLEGGAVQNAIKNPDDTLHYMNQMILHGRVLFRSANDDEEYLSYVSDGTVLVNDMTAIDYMMYNDYLKKTRQDVAESQRCTYVVAPYSFMLIHGGILGYLERLGLPDTKICPLDLQSKDRQLRNSDLLMTYFIMIAGLAAALAVFIGEIIIKRKLIFKNQKQPKTSRSKKKKKPYFDDSRPPPYESLFGGVKKDMIKKIINGREYWVVNKANGETRLIPVRTPSALLYR